jgi:hypothetical protein
MSVNHFLLPITDDELEAILRTPEEVRDLVERRSADVCGLQEDGLAIVALTAESEEDPLAFIRMGAPKAVCGWIGRYSEGDGCVCEVDMGYGPASYYRNRFLRKVASKLRRITAEVFAANCDMDWLADHHIYPSGWRDAWRKDMLMKSFNFYRACILDTAKSGQHLLVWCG